MKVKIIQTLNEGSFEVKLNDFLENNQDIEVIDIKYQTVAIGAYIGYSAMIIYKEIK